MMTFKFKPFSHLLLITQIQNTPRLLIAWPTRIVIEIVHLATCAKDKLREMHVRSPLDFEDSPARMGLIKNNNENYPLNQQKTVPISPQRNAESPQHTLAVKSQCRSESNTDRKVQPRKKDNEKSPPRTSKPSPQTSLSQKRSSPSPTPF